MNKRSGTGRERSHVRAFAERRREAGLCLHRAAARLRISPGYLRGLERGHVPLSLPLAQRMAAEYGTTVRDLIRPAEAGEKGRGGRSGEAPPARGRGHP
jgi:transcriptional regulator with XRE-family HTH domain